MPCPGWVTCPFAKRSPCMYIPARPEMQPCFGSGTWGNGSRDCPIETTGDVFPVENGVVSGLLLDVGPVKTHVHGQAQMLSDRQKGSEYFNLGRGTKAEFGRFSALAILVTHSFICSVHMCCLPAVCWD